MYEKKLVVEGVVRYIYILIKVVIVKGFETRARYG